MFLAREITLKTGKEVMLGERLGLVTENSVRCMEKLSRVVFPLRKERRFSSKEFISSVESILLSYPSVDNGTFGG
jgi:hypothetical protein